MSKLEDRIVELVSDHWTRAAAPLLLSRLGAELRREFSKAEMDRELGGGRLRPYVSGIKKVRVSQNPNNGIVWGLVPSSVTESDEQLFGRIAEKTSSAGATEQTPQVREQVRYDQALWMAFGAPNSDGDQAIRLTDRVEICKIAENEAPPEGFLPLPRGTVPVTATPRERFVSIASRIEGWAKDNNLDISRFKRTTFGRIPSKSLLDHVLESIAEGDLVNISLPLHVVKALAAKKI